MRFLATSVLLGLLVLTAFSQANKPKTSARPKGGATPQKRTTSPQTRAGEKGEWDKAVAMSDPAQRVAALRKFVAAYPRSTRIIEAQTAIVTAEAGMGNDKLAAADPGAAAEYFRSAANDAPKPLPQQLYTDVLSKFAANLYFRGVRDVAIEIAKKLEEKADTSVPQLLDLANFYVSIENGSDAKRLAESAIKLEPNSAQAYQMLGLANRVDFQLEDSAGAYAKAVEVDPGAFQAKRGLAEMDRSLGRSEDAINLYRDILAKDAANLPAKTGLILALFEAGHRTDAEAEMAKSLEENPGNVMLLAGAAYWYAAHDEGGQAVTYAQKAIDADPRFIWSHIALARGLVSQRKPLEAERVLLIARRYGNFPTLEYEIASARLAAGLYRDAAEELSKSFSVKDGSIRTDLGGRVSRESKFFTELIGFERRASIFAPTAADNPENAAQLAALLQFKQELDSAQPDTGVMLTAVDSFVQGDDPMKVHRELFAASQLLEKKLAPAKALELVKAAPRSLEAGLKLPDPVTPVLASELYESRTVALARGEYLRTPDVPRLTLSAILRGRVEDMTGWAMYEADDAAQAAVHLRRAVSVLPADSAWWRESNWRLGNALALAGNDAEALEAYIKTYKSGPPNRVRYSAIEVLYKRVNGSDDGLEAKIGPDPAAPPPSEIASKTPEPEPDPTIEPTPQIKSGTPSAVPVAVDSTPLTEASNSPLPSPAATAVVVEATPEPSPAASVASSPLIEATPENITVAAPSAPPTAATSIPTPEATSEGTPPSSSAPAQETTGSPTPQVPERTNLSVTESTPEVKNTEDKPKENVVAPTAETKKELFPPVIITIPTPGATTSTSRQIAETLPSPTPGDPKGEPSSSPTPVVEETKPSTEASPIASDPKSTELNAAPSPELTPVEKPSTLPVETPANANATPSTSPLPTPIEIIHKDDPAPSPSPAEDPKANEPAAGEKKGDDAKAEDGRLRIAENKPDSPSEVKPCTLTVSEENITLKNGGGDLAVMVGRADEDDDLEGLTAVSTSPQNISIRRETIEGVKARAIFVVRSISAKPGVYQIKFGMPCGSREIVVKVR